MVLGDAQVSLFAIFFNESDFCGACGRFLAQAHGPLTSLAGFSTSHDRVGEEDPSLSEEA